MYCKLINNEIIEAPQNYNGIMNYNLDEDLMKADGWKPLISATIPPETEIRMYHFEYIENVNDITETIVFDETIKEAQERIARLEKERKTYEINQKIEELEKMVTDEILFKHEENIEVYREVIQGLKDTRDNL